MRTFLAALLMALSASPASALFVFGIPDAGVTPDSLVKDSTYTVGGVEAHGDGTFGGDVTALRFFGDGSDLSGVLKLGQTSLTFEQEDLTSLADGIETDFALSTVPYGGSLDIVLDGLLQRSGVDYTLSNKTVSMATAPAADTSSFFALYAVVESSVSILQSTNTWTADQTFGRIFVDTATVSAMVWSSTSTSVNLTAGTEAFILVDASAGQVTVSLPPAAASAGRTYHIKKTDASGNSVVVDPEGDELVDGAETATIPVQYNSVSVICDGATWHIY